jgi:hypothetical protein
LLVSEPDTSSGLVGLVLWKNLASNCLRVVGFHPAVATVARYADAQHLGGRPLRSEDAREEPWLRRYCRTDYCAGNWRDNHDFRRYRPSTRSGKNADRLATPSIRLRNGSGIPRFPVTAFLDFREQNHTFDDMIGLAYLAVR